MDLFAILLILAMSLFGLCNGEDHKPNNVFNLMDFGASGDGINDDSEAFLNGWNTICASPNDDQILLIPEGTYLFNNVSFSGPCQTNKINVQINGYIIAPNTTDWSQGSTPWITFAQVNGLTISGYGTIDGQGQVWWGEFESADQRPTAMFIMSCDNLNLHGLTHLNSQRNHISIHHCNNVSVSNIQIYAPESSPNTDGIDISYSTYVNIRDSIIGTGDDCIAINDGTANIFITNITCGPGHGISVGSLGKDGDYATVENVWVTNSTFNGTMNGARIKTWQGGSGYAKSIHFTGIDLINAGNPILIDQYYCPSGHDCKNDTSAVEVSDVSFTNVTGTSADKVAINLSCSETVGCKNVVVDEVNITSADPGEQVLSYCLNAHGEQEDTVPPLQDCLLP